MLHTKSLAFRLLAVAAGWGVVGLIAGGILLSSLFKSSTERTLDHRLLADINSVIAASELDCSGGFTMPKPFVADRFMRAFSGSYFQVSSLEPAKADHSHVLMQSRSLWDKFLPTSSISQLAEIQVFQAQGPINQNLRILEKVVSISRTDHAESAPTESPCVTSKMFKISAAADLKDMESELESFNNTLFWSVIGLGLTMAFFMAIFVRLGLAPLEQISKSLLAIREGRADKLEGNFPTEIQPLADELNALVKHNAEVVARARTHVGNLAHFLKTPLSVLVNEAKNTSGQLTDAVNKQVHVMRRQVDHYLARARTVASAAVIGARCDVGPTIADLTRALTKIYDAQGITIESTCAEGLVFRGDRSDLEEMLGNLVDNACKWAEGLVTITATSGAAPARIKIQVADDGPGLSEEQKKRVLERGERLDESKPGSGLGLGIVKEISTLYGGSLKLGRAESGGLLVELDLPAVERTSN